MNLLCISLFIIKLRKKKKTMHMCNSNLTIVKYFMSEGHGKIRNLNFNSNIYLCRRLFIKQFFFNTRMRHFLLYFDFYKKIIKSHCPMSNSFQYEFIFFFFLLQRNVFVPVISICKNTSKVMLFCESHYSLLIS